MTTSRPCSDSILQRAPRPELCGLALVMAVLALFAARPVAADTNARDEAISASLVESARSVLSLGYSAEAIGLVEEALSFRPADSDANYLRTLIGASIGEAPALSLARLEQALASGNFRLYRREDARLMYASLLARTRRPEEALRFLQGLPASAEALFVETRARLALNDDSGARTAALSSLRRFPSDPRSVLAWLQNRPRPNQTRADAELVAAAFAAMEALKELDTSILIALAPYAATVDEARLLVREFRALGGQSDRATVLALEYGLINEERAIGEIFSGGRPVSVEQLSRLFRALASADGRGRFNSAFASFSGTVFDDATRDGIPESMVLYDNGAPLEWTLDENQDGIAEMNAVFGADVPVELSLRSGSTRLVVEYASWPYASRVSYSDADGTRRYSLGPAALWLPMIDMVAIGAGGPFFVARNRTPVPAEKAVAAAAHAVQRSGPDTASVSAELYQGQATRAWWTDQAGMSGIMVFDMGFPVQEAIDADGDGRYETRRVWNRGPMGLPFAAWLETDLDGDGIYEYRETLSGPRIQSWDYDLDGAVDMTLETRPDGSLVYRYLAISGRVIEAIHRNGRLEALLENGRQVGISADSGGKLWWVGTKPFDFGPKTPPLGRGSRDGVMFSVFQLDGRLYAQLVD